MCKLNILIVDDNANNRLILKFLLEDYEEKNDDISFNINEASDGLEAVNKCKEESYDIVFMDIMMPNMDGIDATKLIREENPYLIIIAVSAVDDNTRQKKILNNGAEDYIPKPINADIFFSRMSNYITLHTARIHLHATVKSNKNTINNMSDKIYNRNTNFIINSEDSLSEFWEFFLLEAQEKYDNLSDVVRTLFSLSEIYIRLSRSTNIFIEESKVTSSFSTSTSTSNFLSGITSITFSLTGSSYEITFNSSNVILLSEML